ncbi:hypothetical protein [Absidia glauca]|uniref:Uncharacterized protein n=1 Tax=Absidia glauca TaxID=4829 RepID=A0A163JRE4_ABSGL|nr:hypothetical protein [Absidia glauca]
MPASQAIGIDLGTTYSCVAIWEGNRVEVIANDHGNRTTPSYVGFTKNERVIGDVAALDAAWNISNSVYNVKRLIGRSYEEVAEDVVDYPYKVVESNKTEGQPSIEVTFQNKPCTFAPEQISAMVLDYLKRMAARYLNEDENASRKCVITVPAYFNHAQRQATKDAATIAELDCLQIINEPTAAALAYGMKRQKYDDEEGHHVLVYDFGGGTFDVSILHIAKGVYTVKATGGDSHLGGEDIDANMVQHFLKAIQRKHEVDLSSNVRARRRLKSACEVAKRSLSLKAEAILDLPSFLNGDGDYYAVITRKTFEEVNLELFQSTMDTVKKTLDDAKMDKNDIDQVLMVGGSSRIFKLREMLTDFFGKGPNMSVNPDEVVACGAAVQAAVLCGDLEKNNGRADVILRDVTPLSLGIDIKGDVLSIVIPRNTPIPVTKCEVYHSATDNQTVFYSGIYQGERKKASENSLLGTLDLDGIPPAPSGKSTVELTFSLDANGILEVTAKCTATGKSKQIRITLGRLSRQEISRMAADAAKFKHVDDAFMAKAAARTSLESYAYETRFYPMDHQVDPKKQAVNRAVKQVLHWIDDHLHAMKEEFELKQQELEAEIESL